MVDVAEFHTTVASPGRVVLPAALRKALDLHEGDTLNLFLNQDGVVRMVTARQLANSLWDTYVDADVVQTDAKYARVSARRAAVDRSEDDLAAELMADLGLAEPA
jgi:AbrB family looped-hinge helix DNA binding protein